MHTLTTQTALIVTPLAFLVLESVLGLLKGRQHWPGACRRPPQPQAAPQGGNGPVASALPHSQYYPWFSTV